MGGETKVEASYNVYNYYNVDPLKLKKAVSFNKLSETVEVGRKVDFSMDSTPMANGKRESLTVKEVNRNIDNQSQYLTTLCGILCLIFSFAILTLNVGLIVFMNSKIMEGNKILEYFRKDETYEFAIPLMIFPFTFVALYCNWQALKFFRHA